ncbi:MAG: phosphoheptose isomerase [Algoriphagus sp.]|jgi:mannose-6-phosphate isomerase-like protein (cupin superfamily)|uniref:phosphoheptose isomerase n=1 Tax=Algoriphagus sp. TaxID=1872435 RepID=UPI00271F5B6F|nr:phosphoheptose isomerase [Algoriphagus sp.]MDO8967170.1 phosphoheptose isomerase [Algoriphagus sp.]MDP2043156.1 phosphoheptose isomerase [Algoriphagus sp.]MDP3198314.1 phosphoheptose isomerase [Algoriphagus sp.]MDP3470377.1 phosphoheptose isomerase [Algoriphagus sp.]
MEKLEIEAQLNKSALFEKVEKYISDLGYKITSRDLNRPWGGFFVLDESQILKFKTDFFSDVDLSANQLEQKLSPKFLLVAPGARLSWQYHFRRAELWKLIAGKSAISRSFSDEQGPVEEMILGNVVSLQKGERHRLIGTESWGVVAEIWMHADPANPSDEEDIVRLQDDYSRK